jgi:hypothetical protein
MKTEPDDSPTTALALLERTVPGEDHALTESSRPAVSCDIGELFLAELQARRKRLRYWIRLLSEEASLGDGCAADVRGPRYICRGQRLPPRSERRLGAQRHYTAA